MHPNEHVKKIENFLKYNLKQAGDGISAMPPPFYADRFLRFMRDTVIIDQKQGNSNNQSYLRITRRLSWVSDVQSISEIGTQIRVWEELI